MTAYEFYTKPPTQLCESDIIDYLNKFIRDECNGDTNNILLWEKVEHMKKAGVISNSLYSYIYSALGKHRPDEILQGE